MLGLSVSLESTVNELVKDVAREVVKEAIAGTPADTGAARSNWIASLDSPDGTVIPAHAPGKHLGLAETANAAAATEQAEKIIAERKPGQAIYLQNNVPYIGLLNEGSSEQAPQNFIEKAILVVVSKLKDPRILVGPKVTS